MQIFTYNLCYLEPQRQQTSSSFYDLYVAVFFASKSPLYHHYHASPHFALHKDCLISVEDRRWWGKLAGKSVNSQRKDKESTGCSKSSGHSHKSLTIFLFYLPVSRLLEAAANRENSSSRNTQKEITTHELQKRPMFDHCVSVT